MTVTEDQCPSCGASLLDHVSPKRCRDHFSYSRDLEAKRTLRERARPFSARVEDVEDLAALKALLGDYFRSIEP